MARAGRVGTHELGGAACREDQEGLKFGSYQFYEFGFMVVGVGLSMEEGDALQLALKNVGCWGQLRELHTGWLVSLERSSPALSLIGLAEHPGLAEDTALQDLSGPPSGSTEVTSK